MHVLRRLVFAAVALAFYGCGRGTGDLRPQPVSLCTHGAILPIALRDSLRVQLRKDSPWAQRVAPRLHASPIRIPGVPTTHDLCEALAADLTERSYLRVRPTQAFIAGDGFVLYQPESNPASYFLLAVDGNRAVIDSLWHIEFD